MMKKYLILITLLILSSAYAQVLDRSYFNVYMYVKFSNNNVEIVNQEEPQGDFWNNSFNYKLTQEDGITFLILHNEWSDTIKVQCLNCRKSKENGNEKVRSKFQGRGFEALGRHWNQESLRAA